MTRNRYLAAAAASLGDTPIGAHDEAPVTPDYLAERGFELERYTVRASTGEGNIGWPTGFSGTGWALKKDGQVIFRHAFRFDVIAYAESAATREPRKEA